MSNFDKEIFKNSFLKILKKHGLTQKQLAIRLRISTSKLSNDINGVTDLKVEDLFKYAAALGVTVDELCTGRPTGASFPETLRNYALKGHLRFFDCSVPETDYTGGADPKETESQYVGVYFSRFRKVNETDREDVALAKREGNADTFGQSQNLFTRRLRDLHAALESGAITEADFIALTDKLLANEQ